MRALHRLLIIAIMCVLSAPARAQTVTVDANAADLELGPVVVFPVRLDQGRRFGFLAYLVSANVYVVVVSHAERSGFGGVVPRPGLCIDRLFWLPSGDWWQFAGPPRDGDGDGDDDLVLQEVTAPQRFRVINLDLVACR